MPAEAGEPTRQTKMGTGTGRGRGRGKTEDAHRSGLGALARARALVAVFLAPVPLPHHMPSSVAPAGPSQPPRRLYNVRRQEGGPYWAAPPFGHLGVRP